MPLIPFAVTSLVAAVVSRAWAEKPVYEEVSREGESWAVWVGLGEESLLEALEDASCYLQLSDEDEKEFNTLELGGPLRGRGPHAQVPHSPRRSPRSSMRSAARVALSVAMGCRLPGPFGSQISAVVPVSAAAAAST